MLYYLLVVLIILGDNMKLTPIRDRIVVRLLEADTVTKSGIIIQTLQLKNPTREKSWLQEPVKLTKTEQSFQWSYKLVILFCSASLPDKQSRSITKNSTSSEKKMF